MERNQIEDYNRIPQLQSVVCFLIMKESTAMQLKVRAKSAVQLALFSLLDFFSCELTNGWSPRSNDILTLTSTCVYQKFVWLRIESGNHSSEELPTLAHSEDCIELENSVSEHLEKMESAAQMTKIWYRIPRLPNTVSMFLEPFCHSKTNLALSLSIWKTFI